jgi:hypothetical protein
MDWQVKQVAGNGDKETPARQRESALIIEYSELGMAAVEASNAYRVGLRMNQISGSEKFSWAFSGFGDTMRDLDSM